MKLLQVLYLVNTCVSAHTIFQKLYVNGKSPGQLVGIRAPNYDGYFFIERLANRGVLTAKTVP
jgi:hypothetical protein